MGKLINIIPCSRLLISSLPGKALRMLIDIARLAERFNMRSQTQEAQRDEEIWLQSVILRPHSF